ncbi:VIT domain-containing protein [Pelagicoccus mobilis]|uniref:VIT domain-containing protein n=1 Tax=Pelagicoccus mobilis TaxID=415221 RepID=A0A934VN21_9BACT|nr:VIT domain-containing protein [Pelagicoccus mobilis]MBK1879456.1 hypothetical protein [Pelagicoccus mobilis]
MSKWSDAARSYFEDALGLVGATEGGAELAEDIRIHVETEISERKPGLVTKEIVEGIVVRVLGYDPFVKESPARKESKAPRRSLSEIVEDRKNKNGWTRFYGWTFGVILPVITLIFEIVTGACASAFFDPIPSIGHIVLIALVPAGCAWCLLGIGRGGPLGARKILALGGTIAISLYYTIPLAVFMPFAVIGIIFYGFGFLPLAPLFSMLAAFGLIKRLGKGNPEVPRYWRKAGVGFLLGLLVVIGVESPRYLTTLGLNMAGSADPERAMNGIGFLRTFGSEKTILDSCLPEFRNQSGVLWVGPRNSPEQAREIFYRVTGREYYVDADREAASQGEGSVLGMRSRWDWYRGDQVVGRKIHGVSLQHSRIDGVVEADAAHAYLEWTMEFRNDTPMQQEARALWRLPPGAAVTRVNLWVNGEAREAAFNAKSKVVEAYKRVVTRRRDPLLVTTAGKDHVLAQCFPIPRNGGKMKIRLGMVVPLHLESLDQGSFVLPSLVGENFYASEELGVPVWIDSQTMLSSLSLESPDLADTIRTTVDFSDLNGDPIVVYAERDPELTRFWSENPYSGGITQGTVSLETVVSEDSKLIVVLDTSVALSESLTEVRAALERFGDQISKIVVVDERLGYRVFDSPSDFKWKAEGGKDNAPALEHAFQLAENSATESILWIHGPQPRELSSAEGLLRQLSRRKNTTPVYSLSCGKGMNGVLTTLEKRLDVMSVQRFAKSPGTDLNSFLDSRQSGRGRVVINYQHLDGSEEARGRKVADHATRLWALSEAKRILYSRENKAYERSAKLAAQHQLVTPASGAVVLENERQYKEAGLEPVKEGTTASIPDGVNSVILLVFALGSILAIRRLLPARRDI